MFLFTFIILCVFLNLSRCISEENVPSDTIFSLDFQVDFKNVRKLLRFWSSTGFCPPDPTNNSSSLAEFFLSEKTAQNMEYISALPNNGLKVVRIHWLPNLIEFIGFDESRGLLYEFSNLDKFLDHLMEIRLFPVIEFMGNPSNTLFNQKQFSQRYLWKDFVYQLVSRYIKFYVDSRRKANLQKLTWRLYRILGMLVMVPKNLERYGIRKIKQWKFETWNEPDLRQYNTLNYSLNDYEDYINGVREGLNEAGLRDNNYRFSLSGPAGLFKNNKTHHLCWGILDRCNANLTMCPLDILSYHRKGLGKAEDVINDSIELIDNISTKFPKLKNMKMSNSEADPTTGWSKPLDMNCDVRYAVILVNIVLLHWNAKYNKIFQVDSISHDNAFISYHPHEFYQRTLLALFQLNNTKPVEIHLIEKPVYAALGMLGNLASYAGALNNGANITSLWTKSHPKKPLFVCGIISSELKSIRQGLTTTNVNVALNMTDHNYVNGERFISLIEYLEGDVTDPAYVWKVIGKPPYPNATERQLMRKSQGPRVLTSSVEIHRNDSYLSILLNVELKSPWIISIRICSELLPIPSQIKLLRIRRVNDDEILLFWKEKFTKSRCTKTYEIYFLPHGKSDWINLALDQHVPFMSYHFAPNVKMNLTTRGKYWVRAVDLFQRKGKFSLIKTFN